MGTRRNSRSRRKSLKQRGGETKEYTCTCKSINGASIVCTCTKAAVKEVEQEFKQKEAEIKEQVKVLPAPEEDNNNSNNNNDAYWRARRSRSVNNNNSGGGGFDIGVFVTETDLDSKSNLPAEKSSGADLLVNDHLLFNVDTELIKEVVSSVCKDVCSPSNDLAVESDETLNKGQCFKLIELADNTYSKFKLGESLIDTNTLSNLEKSVHSGSRLDDFKTILSVKELTDVIGDKAYEKICDTLGLTGKSRSPDAIAIRRTVAENRWINFHTDNALKTVQVPLSHDNSCVGGKLVFALPDGSIVKPTRVPGSILYHHGDVVHGVTRLTSGTRYGLFVLVSR